MVSAKRPWSRPAISIASSICTFRGARTSTSEFERSTQHTLKPQTLTRLRGTFALPLSDGSKGEVKEAGVKGHKPQYSRIYNRDPLSHLPRPSYVVPFWEIYYNPLPPKIIRDPKWNYIGTLGYVYPTFKPPDT